MDPVAACSGMVDDTEVSFIIKRLETFEHKRLCISNSATGLQLKHMIAEAWGDAHTEQRLCYGMTVTDDDKTLAFYDIINGAVGLRHCGGSVRANRLIVKSGQVKRFMVMWRQGDVIEFIRERVAKKLRLLAPGLITLSSSKGSVLMDGEPIVSYGLRHYDTITFVTGGGVGGGGSGSEDTKAPTQ